MLRKDMKNYYISRGVFAILFGILSYLISGSVLSAVLFAGVIMALFIYLPHSGRYKVKPENGITALRRDEWTERITQQSGRNAWVAVTLAGAGIVFYYGRIAPGDVPVNLLGLLLSFGMVVYFASDFWLRRM
jgi:hypothetical protein